MFRRHTARKISAWIACFAVLLAALAPAVSHAISAYATGDAGWLEICSEQGPRLVRTSSEPAEPEAPGQKHFSLEHCAFCMPHSQMTALPAVSEQPVLVPSGRDLLPALFLDAPRPLHAWTSALSRAPPALS